MTDGRFVLYRKEDKGKGSAQQGLELEVFDFETGKRRDVKTLSGGETFKAALSLALISSRSEYLIRRRKFLKSIYKPLVAPAPPAQK